jgi:type IV pilus assembly protein PilQ
MPLLGYLFRTTSKSATKRELLIFVTPQILKEGKVAE